MQDTLDPIETIKFTGFEDEPMVTRRSYLYGDITLYAPLGPKSHWGELPWLLRTEIGGAGPDSPGLRHMIRADAIQHCLNHISIIHPSHLWVDPDGEDPLA